MGDEVENVKQVTHNVNPFIRSTDMLDKVNSKITEQTFECVEDRKKS